MTDTTPSLALPYLAADQAQKHVTVNESLRALDAVVQIGVISSDRNAPPDAPEDGERHLVGPEPTAAWEGHAAELAAWQDGAWAFYPPRRGWLAWVADLSAMVVHDGAGWAPLFGSAAATDLPRLGVNTSSDGTNRLAVKSDAILFSHDDTTPGSGDVRIVVNNSGPAATGALLFQTNYAGRAELGLTGTENFSLKVSADGSSFTEAMTVDRATGRVSLPATPPLAAPFNLLNDAGRFAGSPEPAGIRVSSFVEPTYFGAYNDLVIAEGPQFFHNNASFGGTAPALDPLIEELVTKRRSAISARRYGVEFHTLDLTAGNGDRVPLPNQSGHYLVAQTPGVPIPAQLSVNYNIRVIEGSIGIIDDHLARTFVEGVPLSGSTLFSPVDGWLHVAKLYDREMASFLGYHPNAWGLYAAPGTRMLLAAPAVAPGHIPVGPDHLTLVTPSLTAWR